MHAVQLHPFPSLGNPPPVHSHAPLVPAPSISSSRSCGCRALAASALAAAAAAGGRRLGIEEGSVLDEAEGPGGIGSGRMDAALRPHTLPITDQADAGDGERCKGKEEGGWDKEKRDGGHGKMS